MRKPMICPKCNSPKDGPYCKICGYYEFKTVNDVYKFLNDMDDMDFLELVMVWNTEYKRKAA